MKTILFKTFPLFLFMSYVCGTSIGVIFPGQNSVEELKTMVYGNQVYCSTNDLSRILKCGFYHSDKRGKIVLYIENRRVKVSAQSSFVLVDDHVYQIPNPGIGMETDIFLPATGFFTVLKSSVFPGLHYDSQKKILEIDVKGFNINKVEIDEKANGTILYIKTREEFPEGHISAFKHKNGWFYVTVKGGIIDSEKVEKTYTRGNVRKVSADQLSESAQLAFKLGSEIEGHELYQTEHPSEIVITLRTPIENNLYIKSMKNQWFLDTVVLDAGHGGKDGGTRGKRGTKEKDITLDITKRLGSLIEKNTRIKVIYTREEDVFIPLKRRTQMANEKKGKLFISIHANANPNKKVRGFETYLLRPGKTEDAIAVASRENSVINLEENKTNFYDKLEGTNLIMATMAQSMYMKESEDLADKIQKEIAKKVSSKNRGVKQAGFYVLVGASMPNVLVEVGFLSNRHEEKLLRKKSYRQNIAEGIFQAILQFKQSKEEMLAKG
ncbi:MAG: N-acetylmuramoyl-L-alanine amidase [Candidatus Marinimicrobia bacterium]|jgi:N-acetylmuramoyl-L-alanine amidase|nr:N-acetylmuramoyl-L-alanine amidase [Candidatus Neomarinimicrobiota bacterium]